MFVLCKKNIDSSNPLVLPVDNNMAVSEENYFISKEWYSIDADHSGYCLSIGQKYIVFGILFYKGTVRFLVIDDEGIPGFFPSTLFDIVQNDVFFDWCFCKYLVGKEEIVFVGYPALCSSYTTLVSFIALEPDYISVFLEYKAYVQENQIAFSQEYKTGDGLCEP